MVALDPKFKETLTVDHSGVDGLILVESFHVSKEGIHLVARANYTQVSKIAENYDYYNYPGLQEIV